MRQREAMCVVAVMALLAGLLAFSACATKRQVKLELTREEVVQPPEIRSVSVEPSGRLDTRSGAQPIKVTMLADPGLTATFDAGPQKGLPMREVSPGVYEGAYTAPQGATGDLSFVGHVLHQPSGAKQMMAGGAQVTLFQSAPPQPPPEVASCTSAMAASLAQELGALTVYFNFDRSELSDQGKTQLGAVPQVLARYPLCQGKVLVAGHTDVVGEARYNDALSEKRAQGAGAYLEKIGVPVERLEMKGFGATQPAAAGKSAEANRKNRRVEVRYQP